jgi:hypothetical protein
MRDAQSAIYFLSGFQAAQITIQSDADRIVQSFNFQRLSFIAAL